MPDPPPATRVLLVGWDAADWRMIDPLLEAGLMPHLAKFIEQGVMGNVASLSPMLSPILWTSIATGKHADKHGILGFAEPDGTTGRVRPVTSTSRTCKAIWNILAERGRPAGAINWFASHPAEPVEGFVVTDRFPHPAGPLDAEWPLVAGSVHPAEVAPDLAAVRLHPGRTTPAQLLPFVPRLAEHDFSNDERFGQLRVMLAQCATVHAAATHLMQTRPWDFLGIYHDAIDRFGHVFMEFHPPQRPDVSDEDFARYRDVMTGCYRFHDMMLGRLLALAGDDTTVIIVSDHGFYSDEGRPAGSGRIRDGQPVAWHRPYGILAARGPGIRRDERVYGASLLDVTPTILAMLGLPVAEDMDGKPLTQIFEQAIEIETIPTYESGAPRAEPAPDEDPWMAQQMLEQLRALGYLGEDDTESVVVDRDRSLGQVLLSTGRPGPAIEPFERVLEKRPDDMSARLGIASCLLHLGRVDECETLVDAIVAEHPESAHAHLSLGMIRFRRGDAETALVHLRRAEEVDPRLPGIQTRIGQVYLRRRRWGDAERVFTAALERDADDAEAHDGLGVALRHLGQPARAVHEHMEAIGRLHHRPQSHVNLGLVLAQTGRITWAIRAFETALDMAPDHAIAHQGLAQLYALNDRDPERATLHRERADALIGRRERSAGDTGTDR